MTHAFYLILGILSAVVAAPTLQSDHQSSDIQKAHPQQEAGYFFALQSVPLSEKQYIFTADPLKRAYFTNENQSIYLRHLMTLKTSRGFDMYFSGAEHRITLSITKEEAIDEQSIAYKGTLLVQKGREKHRYAIHGVQNK